ncbi:unnamed protein product [Cyprideis torosa]|uniref:Tafazzin family protein n=1 Tax=Cyprideis torosa TaxID=163714 RepID=A0A7R8WAM1_9CRUS|nr:unnamed protein product [Cyprideis torosa]CAG0891176.1 unnamed protein product [Cyprideis torosa]
MASPHVTSRDPNSVGRLPARLNKADDLYRQLRWTFPVWTRRNAKLFFALRTLPAISVVGGLSKIWLSWLNRVTVEGSEKLSSALEQHRNSGQGLVTVCNHYSCYDDPGLWSAILPYREFFQPKTMRWSSAAEDICFTNKPYSWFFSSGKVVPLVRGWGVYQKGMDFLLHRLNEGQWVHIFPEGRVNLQKQPIRLKWGVGRLVAEAAKTPLVLPFWHIGMDRVLPPLPPYIPRFRKKVLVVFGDPIDFSSSSLVSKTSYTARERRKGVTDVIQTELFKVRDVAEEIWANNFETAKLTAFFGSARTNNSSSPSPSTATVSRHTPTALALRNPLRPVIPSGIYTGFNLTPTRGQMGSPDTAVSTSVSSTSPRQSEVVQN